MTGCNWMGYRRSFRRTANRNIGWSPPHDTRA